MSRSDDVYSSQTYVRFDAKAPTLAQWSLRVSLENSPMSLARVYDILATLYLVPDSTHSIVHTNGRLELELGFERISAVFADHLSRKVTQLSEIVDWQIDPM